MKNILKTLLVLISFSSLIAVSSCTKDPVDKCLTVVCQNNGTCLDGTCTCPAGYEGTNCEIQERAKFLGTYSATDNPGSLTYSVTVGNASSITGVVISSAFSDDYFVNSISATVDGNVLTIAKQEPDNDDYFVSGTGTITGKTIAWTYIIYDGTVSPEDQRTFSGSWTKP